MPDLVGVRAKFQRGRAHAEEFDQAAQKIINDRPFGFDVNVEPDGWCHIRWKQMGDLPDLNPLALIFSDMLYNLRAALDYLSWQLVIRNGQQPGRNTSFPCVLDAANWQRAVTGPLNGIDGTWIAEIAKLQPFDSSHTGDPESHPLAILDKANNVAKHRLLPATLMSAGYASHKISGLAPGATMNFFFNDVPIADGVDHFKFTFNQPTNITVAVDPAPRFRIKFTDVPDCDWKNWDIVNWVETALEVFAPAFV